jgi:hypothetical protein
MQQQLRFDHLEYSNPHSEAVYLRQPLTAAELRQRFPRLRGIEFDFGRTAFAPLRYDHQVMFAEILEAFNFEEIRIESIGRVGFLPDSIWKPSVKYLNFGYRSQFDLKPPKGFENRLKTIFLCGNAAIDEAVFDTPTLEAVSVQNFQGSLRGLECARNLKTLHLTAVGIDFDLRLFSKLETLELSNIQHLETLPNLSDLKNLREIQLGNLPNFKALPGGLDVLPMLEKLRLSSIGHAEKGRIPFMPGLLPALKRLSLQNCHFDFSPGKTVATLPVLEELQVYDAFVEHLPDVFFPKNLRAAYLNLAKTPTLPADFWCCENLEKLSGMFPAMEDFGAGWQVFSNIKNVELVSEKPVRRWPDFGPNNLALAQISLKSPETGQLPADWNTCPALSEIRIDKGPAAIPAAWSHFPALQMLSLANPKGPVFLPRELALSPDLKRLDISEIDGRPRPQIELIRDVHRLLAKHEVPAEQRLVLGHLLFENVKDAPEYDNAFKINFLKTLNLNVSALKQVVWDNTNLLNPQRAIFPENVDFSGKTIFAAGATKRKKADYKEKLTALGAIWQAKITPDTQIVLLGDACPDLPDGFWDAPHWFCTEPQLEPTLKNAQPGFMQVLETDDLQHVRRLIWSNDPANERVVLEMMKNGGVPDGLVPDLMIVAKTSREDAVRNGFRNLLKAIVPPHYRAILSDSRDLMKIFQRFYGRYPMPELEYSQMLVTHFQRSGEGLEAFFELKAGIENPFRDVMLQRLWPKLLERAHYLDARRYLLSGEEVERLLNEPVFRGQLKRLTLQWAGDSFPNALFQHTTLNELEVTCHNCTLVPEAFGNLTRLKTLWFNSRDLHTLPDSLTGLKNIKQGSIYTALGPEISASEAVRATLEGRVRLQKGSF